MLVKQNYTAESGHWYTQDGEPAYTIVGANGRERNTTLRDARKLGLVPSVTTIIGVAARPGLENWKIDQALLAALTLPREDGESLDSFMARAKLDARQQSLQAAQEGERIHAAVERHFLGQAYDPAYDSQVAAVQELLWDHFQDQEWSAEKAFTSPLGYGGKVDLHSQGIVLDFKTKDGDLSGRLGYPEQAMQLAAYAHGLGIPDARLVNVFISRDVPGRVELVEHEQGPHFAKFRCLLEYWKLEKGYRPEDVA